MKTLSLAALALALALPASAGPHRAKIKERPLSSLIKIAMTEGTTSFVSSAMAAELAIDKTLLVEKGLPVRLFAYGQAICPDDQKHVFNVAYSVVDNKPLFLIFSVYRGWREGETIMADGYTLKADLNGRLEKIVGIKGIVGQGDLRRIDAGAKEALDVIAHELEFYSKTSVPLKRSPK